MRVFTCTPVCFPGDASFFGRDSGLFAAALLDLGIESRAIMPGPAMANDDPRLIRTDYPNLESTDWWKTLQLDGLVLYSWAAPRYNKVAEAASRAGIRCLVSMDTNGLISPRATPANWYREIWGRMLHEQPTLAGKATDFAKAFAEIAFRWTSRRRLRHYDAAYAIAVATPHAALWIPNEARRLGREDLASKFIYLPHPQLPIFSYDGRPKQKVVLTAGRWLPEDWNSKNPRPIMQAFERFLSRRPDWKVMVIGRGATDLQRRLNLKIQDCGSRMEFIEHLSQEDLTHHLQTAKIGFWASRWEGQQGTGAQMLCCGGSIVSYHAARTNCFSHYFSRESGRLALRCSAEALADELVLEADSWGRGERDPARISRIWCEEFHAPAVARKALDCLGLPRQS
jgi:glycosyltransferase involved in cell wall biosynthesis